MKEIYENEIDDVEVQERLYKIAKSSIGLRLERKVIQKERTIVDTMARELAEKTVVAEVMKSIWGKEPEHNILLDVARKTYLNEEVRIYAFADVHWGYYCDLLNNKYNNEIATLRIREMFDKIIEEVLRKGYKEIYMADLGDQIEGEALRISQLVRITEGMTKQANNYASLMKKEYTRLAKELKDVKITLIQITDDNHSQLRLYGTGRNEMPENLSVMIGNEIKNMVDLAHEYDGMLNLDVIVGDEILVSFDGYNVVFAHGHQYGRKEDILASVEHRHQKRVHAFIAGHWHAFSVKYKNLLNGIQQVLIFLPAVVGDTDFAETLFLSGRPGFAKISIDTENKLANAKFKPLTN
jgi:hypothetical protein